MNRINNLYWLSIALILGILNQCSGPTDGIQGTSFHDDFLHPPTSPWTWIREISSSHRSTQNGLEIRLEPGSLMGEGKDVKNILVRPLPTNAKSVQLTVNFQPKLQFEQAGLILYTHDDQYIKLVKEYVDDQPWIVMAIEIKSKITFLNKIPVPADSVKIALELKEGKVTGICWFPEGTKSPVGSGEFPMNSHPRIGIFTQNGTPDQERWAQFTDFTIEVDES